MVISLQFITFLAYSAEEYLLRYLDVFYLFFNIQALIWPLKYIYVIKLLHI